MRERMEHDQLETIRTKIRERLAALGISANEASNKAGLGLSYTNDLLAGRSKRPNMPRLQQLAKNALECDLDYLLGLQDAPVSGASAGPSQSVPSALKIYPPELPDREGFFRTNTNQVANFNSPITKGQYALFVPDDSNAPRYMSGEVVICDPLKPASANAFARITMTDGRSLIRRIKSITSSEVILESLTGENRTIPREEIGTIHKIIGSFIA